MNRFFARSSIRWFLGVGVALALTACGDSRTEHLIQKADDAWIKGHNHTAIEILKSVLNKTHAKKTVEEALLRLGEISYFSLGNPSQALVYFQELLHLDQKDPFSYQAHKYIAEIVEFSIKDYDQAIIEYQKLIDEFGESGESGNHQYRIASIYYKKQDYEQALVELELLIEKYPDSTWVEESAYKITNLLYTLGRCEEARRRHRGFVEQYPDSNFLGEMEFVMASCLEDEGKLQEALRKFKSLEKTYPYPTLLKMKMAGIQSRIQKKADKKNKSKFNRHRSRKT